MFKKTQKQTNSLNKLYYKSLMYANFSPFASKYMYMLLCTVIDVDKKNYLCQHETYIS